MERTAFNTSKLDKAIALGAALIANGKISVQERLLHDIGIAIDIGEDISLKLGLPKGTKEIFLTPILKKGTPLPARMSTRDFIPLHLKKGDDITIRVIIDDDSADPWVQTQKITMPSGIKSMNLEVALDADSDGALILEVSPIDSKQKNLMSLDFKHERLRSGRASIVLGWVEDTATKILRVSPEQLSDVYKKDNWGAKA